MTTIIKNYEDTIDRECLESRIRVLSDERREVIADLAESRNRG